MAHQLMNYGNKMKSWWDLRKRAIRWINPSSYFLRGLQFMDISKKAIRWVNSDLYFLDSLHFVVGGHESKRAIKWVNSDSYFLSSMWILAVLFGLVTDKSYWLTVSSLIIFSCIRLCYCPMKGPWHVKAWEWDEKASRRRSIIVEYDLKICW